jgi:glucose/arabinose dehydrogenase
MQMACILDHLRSELMVGLLATAIAMAPASARIADSGSEESDFTEIDAVRIAGPYEFPWSLAFLPDNAILLTERPGLLQLIESGASPREIAGLPPIQNAGLGGLLDVAVDPDFARNRYIYFSYTHGDTAATTLRIMRARLDVARYRLSQRRVLFETAEPVKRTEQHGGRLVITPDGFLFLSVGDRWQTEAAQDLSTHLGKILRIRTDGSIPRDNPFVGVSGARQEIWSFGHRNPQGLAYEESARRLWSHEHGPMGGDELNLILPKRNYGWPVITHGLGYDGKPVGIGSAKEGMEQPFHPIDEAIAPSGLAVESSVPLRFSGLARWPASHCSASKPKTAGSLGKPGCCMKRSGASAMYGLVPTVYCIF